VWEVGKRNAENPKASKPHFFGKNSNSLPLLLSPAFTKIKVL
jgi:hypothetical protein